MKLAAAAGGSLAWLVAAPGVVGGLVPWLITRWSRPADPRLFAYLVIVGVAMEAFVRAYEEPTLRRTYGATYDEFCAAVPRWWPRLTPWRGAATTATS